MSTPGLPDIEPEEFAALLADSFATRLAECQQAYILEDLAREVAGPDIVAMLPELFAETAFGALVARSGTRVLFEAASRVCAPHLVTRMNELAAEREAAGDRSSTLVSLVGDLSIEELFRIESEGDEDTRVALLARPKQKRSQLLMISRDRRLPNAPLRLGTLTEPLSPRRIEQLFSEMRAEREVPVTAAPDEFPPWLVDGAEASAELMPGPTAGAGEIVVQLLRQIGEPELADRISRLFPLDLEYEEAGADIDQAAYDVLLEEIEPVIQEFERWLIDGATHLDDEEIALAGQDAELALEFRANVLGAGVDGPWTDEELDAFLLSWIPAKVMTSEDDHGRMPVSLEWLFRFLGERGDVIPPAADKLARRAVALTETFAKRASDPTRRGPSGALIEAMLAEGVDLADRNLVEAWMAGFNERPLEERDAILGMSLPARPEDEPD